PFRDQSVLFRIHHITPVPCKNTIVMFFQLGRKPHQTGRETKQNQGGGLTSLEGRGHEDRPRNIVPWLKKQDVVNPIFIGRRQVQLVRRHPEKLVPNQVVTIRHHHFSEQSTQAVTDQY